MRYAVDLRYKPLVAAIPGPCALNAILPKEIKRVTRLRRNPSTICNCSLTQGLGDLRMAEKTLLEKAGAAVGFGMAMAEDVAGTVKTAVGVAVTTVTDVLKTAPAKKARAKRPPPNLLQRRSRPRKWSERHPRKK